MRTYPLQATLRWLGILFSCALAGVVAGAVTYAPLHRPAPVAMAVSVLAGLLYGGLWNRQQRVALRGLRSTARRWGWGLLLAPFVLILGVVALALLQLYSMGQFRPLTQDRVANFERLIGAMGAAYPYFDEKQIDWEAMVAMVRPQIEAAQTDDEYFGAIAALLADLNDGHTSLSQLFPQITRLGQLAEIEGQAVIVATGPSAEAAGLAVGDVVLAVDGKDVEAAIASLPPRSLAHHA